MENRTFILGIFHYLFSFLCILLLTGEIETHGFPGIFYEFEPYLFALGALVFTSWAQERIKQTTL